MTGDQPEGKMTVEINKSMKCDGYPAGTIIIKYKMHAGTRNGKAFSGTERWAYLPNTKEGMEVCNLLQKAFERKLIFTVGQSVTTGTQWAIVWNGVHHKTNTSGGTIFFVFLKTNATSCSALR